MKICIYFEHFEIHGLTAIEAESNSVDRWKAVYIFQNSKCSKLSATLSINCWTTANTAHCSSAFISAALEEKNNNNNNNKYNNINNKNNSQMSELGRVNPHLPLPPPPPPPSHRKISEYSETFHETVRFSNENWFRETTSVSQGRRDFLNSGLFWV